MVDNYSKLQARYEGRIRPAKVELNDNTLTVEYIQGTPLSDIFEEFIAKGDTAAILDALDTYRDNIYYCAGDDAADFKVTPEFTEVFGEPDTQNYYNDLEKYGFLSSSTTDIDMVFDNIILADTWNLIDYEWTFNFPIPREFVLYRTLWYWYNSTEVNEVIEWHTIMEHFGISHNMELTLRHMEVHLQSYISGGRKTIEQILAESDMRNKEIDSSLLEKAAFYEEGQWYKQDYMRLKLQQQLTDNAYHEALAYKKTADKLLENYNNLLDLYQTPTPPLLKRVAKRILRRPN